MPRGSRRERNDSTSRPARAPADGPADGRADGRANGEVLDDVGGPGRLERLTPRAREAIARSARGGRRATAAARDARVKDRFDQGPILVFPTGGTATEVTLTRPRVEELLRDALAVADDTPSVVWVQGDSELAVHAQRTRVALGRGTLVVGVRVECDQTGPAEVAVPFALGSTERAAGLVMAAPARPDGPPQLVEQWGAVLVAAVYRALLDVVSAAAATAGVDTDGTPLLPGAVASDGERLTVVPQARHAIDRRQLL